MLYLVWKAFNCAVLVGSKLTTIRTLFGGIVMFVGNVNETAFFSFQVLEVNVVALGRVEGEAEARVRVVKLIFIEDLEAIGCQDGSSGNMIFLQVVLGIAQIPIAEINGRACEVAQFDGVLKGRVGVSQH